MKITIEEHRVAGVPAFECYPAESERKLPTVIIMHGFSGKKEDNFFPAYHLAKQGYYAVTVDLHLHGELGPQPFIPAEVSPRLLEVVQGTVDNITRLVNHYQDHPIADGDRIGLVGISLGGVAIHAYLPNRAAQVRAGVVMIAGLPPFYAESFQLLRHVYPDFGVTDALIEALLADSKARPFLENVTDFPLLWQYGKDDPVVPIERVRTVYQSVHKGYTIPEHFELVEFDHCGHETPPGMYARAAEWLGKFLK